MGQLSLFPLGFLRDLFTFQGRAAPSRGRIRRTVLRPAGRHHDLTAILSELNARFFDGTITAAITWGRGGARKRRRRSRHITLGSYSRTHRLITIHPALDGPLVPRFFVEAIVFHEMCHEIAGEERSGGRRRLHTEAFRALEMSYPLWADAKRWGRENLNLLISWRPQTTPSR